MINKEVTRETGQNVKESVTIAIRIAKETQNYDNNHTEAWLCASCGKPLDPQEEQSLCSQCEALFDTTKTAWTCQH